MIYLRPAIDPLVCGRDVITTYIAWSIISFYSDLVLQHFKESTNVFFFNLAVLLSMLLVKLFYMPMYMFFICLCDIT